MIEQDIIRWLKAGKTVEIDNIWYFTDRHMTCTHADEEYSCCADSYESIEEAAENAITYGKVTNIY